MMNKLISFLSGGQSDFLIPLSHQWHGVNVAPPLYVVAFLGAFAAITLFGVGCWRALRRHPFAVPFLLAIIFATAAYAASSTLSGLTAGGAISDTDLFYDVQSIGSGGVKITGLQLRTYVAAHVVTSVAGGCGTNTSPNPITTTGTLAFNWPSNLVSAGAFPYTLQISDCGTNVVIPSGGGNITVPAATTSGFGNGYVTSIVNQDTASHTVTFTTSTLDGMASFTLAASTSTTKASLVFQSDGTNYHCIAGCGGSGGGISAYPCGYTPQYPNTSGFFYSPYGTSAGVGGSASTAGKIVLVPFCVGEPVTIGGIAVSISTPYSGTGSGFGAAIYNSGTGVNANRPNAKIAASSFLTTTGTGDTLISFTSNAVITTPGLYWMAFEYGDATQAVQRMDNSANINLAGIIIGASSMSAARGGIYGVLFDNTASPGTWPSTIGSTTEIGALGVSIYSAYEVVSQP